MAVCANEARALHNFKTGDGQMADAAEKQSEERNSGCRAQVTSDVPSEVLADIDDAIRKGCTYDLMCKHFHLSHKFIVERKRELGLPVRKFRKLKGSKQQKRVRISQNLREQLCSATDEGETIRNAAKRLGISYDKARKAVGRHRSEKNVTTTASPTAVTTGGIFVAPVQRGSVGAPSVDEIVEALMARMPEEHIEYIEVTSAGAVIREMRVQTRTLMGRSVTA